MKSFSPAGAATKAYYGLGARTFGNPGGATSGNGAINAGGGIAPFTRRATFPADTLTDVAILDATHAAVVTQAANAGFTADGGQTWTPVAGPLGLISQTAMQVVANQAGTALVALGLDGLSVFRLSHSGDGGQTWGNVTPGGANVGQAVYYSSTANVFFFFDAVTADVWVSTTGLVWISHAIPSNLSVNGAVQNDNNYGFAEGGGVLVVAALSDSGYEIWRSVDAINWAVAFSDTPQAFISLGNLAFDGANFIACYSPDGVAATHVLLSSVAATVWTLQSVSASTNVAPYQFRVCPFTTVALGLAILNGFRQPDGINVARSVDGGASWQPTNTTAIAGFGLEGITVQGATVYGWGDGIMASSTGLTWQSVLANFAGGTGFINSMKAAAGLLFAVGVDDAGNGGIWT